MCVGKVSNMAVARVLWVELWLCNNAVWHKFQLGTGNISIISYIIIVRAQDNHSVQFIFHIISGAN